MMMKTAKLLAYAGTIALLSTGFTACSSEDDVVAENPTYDPVEKTVTAQFVLNVASNPQANTRMTAATVQKNSNFRGIQDAKLIGLSTGKANTFIAPYNGEATTGFTVCKTFNLGTLYAQTAVDNIGSNNRDNSSRRVLELSLPLTTDAMLVYGRAIPQGTDATNGKVKMNITSNPENSTFDLTSRLGNRSTEYAQVLKLAALILNRIMSSQIAASTAVYKGYSDFEAMTWKGLADAKNNNEDLSPLEEILADAYLGEMKKVDGEYRAGSSKAICSQIYYLNKTMQSVLAATATNKSEANAQRMAEEIAARIANYFTELAAENTTTFKTLGSVSQTNTLVYSLVNSAHVLTETEYSTQFGLVQQGDLRDFPTSFGLPAGVAQIKIDDDGKFTYDVSSSSLIKQGNTLNASNYMYPAELLYFNNSLLRVNDVEKSESEYPNGYKVWDEDTWTGWNVGKVSSTTRSVAVKNNINYGVAMLQSKVALDGTSFIDNRENIITTESNQTLTDTDVKKFRLTGILIGGQNHQMGWNYLAKSNAEGQWDYVIYDSEMNGAATIPTGAGYENYTLVFDNYDSSGQKDVYVALEFENSAKDFYGKHNLIRNGGTFYLMAKLELDTKTVSTWDNYYAIPPYTATGASDKTTRIFIQDYMTCATFKIGNTSLQNALLTVPDLRSSQTSLGLSVDLNWQPGLSFDNVVLGN